MFGWSLFISSIREGQERGSKKKKAKKKKKRTNTIKPEGYI